MKATKILLALSCVFLVGACQTLDEFMSDNFGATDTSQRRTVRSPSPGALLDTCPHVKIVDELSSLSEFGGRNFTAEEDLMTRVNLAQAESACSYNNQAVTVDLKLVFEGMLGPKATVRSSDKAVFSYPFFVAVTDPSGRILAKEVFGANLEYPQNAKRHTYYESLRQVIPLRRQEEGVEHKILIGFQLNANQLEYNRANMVPVDADQIPLPAVKIEKTTPQAYQPREVRKEQAQEQRSGFGNLFGSPIELAPARSGNN